MATSNVQNSCEVKKFDVNLRQMIVGTSYAGKSCLLLQFVEHRFEHGIYTIGVACLEVA